MECSLGQWIYGHALREYGHIPEVHDLEEIHRSIHDTAGKLISLYSAGQIEEARDGFLEVEVIAANLINLLSVLEFKVKSEGTQKSETNFSEELRVNYNELLQLNIVLQGS